MCISIAYHISPLLFIWHFLYKTKRYWSPESRSYWCSYFWHLTQWFHSFGTGFCIVPRSRGRGGWGEVLRTCGGGREWTAVHGDLFSPICALVRWVLIWILLLIVTHESFLKRILLDRKNPLQQILANKWTELPPLPLVHSPLRYNEAQWCKTSSRGSEPVNPITWSKPRALSTVQYWLLYQVWQTSLKLWISDV